MIQLLFSSAKREEKKHIGLLITPVKGVLFRVIFKCRFPIFLQFVIFGALEKFIMQYLRSPLASPLMSCNENDS